MQRLNSKNAPQAIGAYSQAVQFEKLVFISGQIALDPISMEMCNIDVQAEVHQIFANLRQICLTAGGDLTNIVKLTVYLVDINYAAIVNQVMGELFIDKYPARAMLEISKLPKDARVEIDAIMALS